MSRRARTGSRRLVATSAAGALAGLGALLLCAPEYLSGRGFPLDDAWIHAVYARELARSWTLAYNPGIPSTGATSPLWPALLAPLHALAPSGAAVLLTKLLGFVLHAATAGLLAAGLGDGDDRRGARRWGRPQWPCTRTSSPPR